MASKKISPKRKGYSAGSLPQPVKLKPGVKLIPHDPGKNLRNTDRVLESLFECLVTDDFEAFKEIVVGHLEAKNISSELQHFGISRRSFYNAMSDNGNPTWDLITKIFKMISAQRSQQKTPTRKRAS